MDAWQRHIGAAWAVVWLVMSASIAEAADVTTRKARRQSLLQYIESRADLGKGERAAWKQALKTVFGGKAIKDGRDEGITVAKSVLSGAIFFEVPPAEAVRAAYAAFHDTHRWVPPPIAINYRMLAFQGQEPEASPRQLAFRFPRHFSAELAPDVVAWWDRMLRQGRINPHAEARVRRTLAKTRRLMRPMLRARLWEGARLHARRRVLKASGAAPATLEALERQLADLARELEQSFRGVAPPGATAEADLGYYERYVRLSRALGKKPRPRPQGQPPKPSQPSKPSQPPKPGHTPKTGQPPKRGQPHDRGGAANPDGALTNEQSPTAKGSNEPEDGRQQPPKDATSPTRQRPEKHRGQSQTEARQSEATSSAATKSTAKPSSRPSETPVAAPLPGEPLISPFNGWSRVLARTVKKWLGVPYRFGGASKRGVDCSALTRRLYREAVRIQLPRNSRAQFRRGTRVRKSNLERGDLLFFDTLDRGRVTHVGVYMGKGRFVHASSSRGVTYSQFQKPYYQRAYWGARRLLSVP